MADSASTPLPATFRPTCPAWCNAHETDTLGDIHATLPSKLPSGGSVWMRQTVGMSPRIVVDAPLLPVEELTIPDAVALAAAVTALTVLIQGVAA